LALTIGSMILDLRRPAAASGSGRHLPHQEGAQDEDAPEDHARLLEAARAVLRLLDGIDAHAPERFAFGGEAKVRRQLAS
jgi:hypothetical protein